MAAVGNADRCMVRSSGLFWNRERLYGRYKFLRELREEVSFDLLYYPYWFVRLAGTVKWRFWGAKRAEQLRILDGRTARSLRLLSAPELIEETVEFLEEPAGGRFAAARVLSGGEALAVDGLHVAPFAADREEALRRGREDALREMLRFYNRPLGFRAEIEPTELEAESLYKPFWVMRAANDRDKAFVFDASTGLGGVAEYWNVVEYLFQAEN